MRPFTPSQLGPTSQALRDLGELGPAALAQRLEGRPGFIRRVIGGSAAAEHAVDVAWLWEAMAPWREASAGKRTFHMRTANGTTLGRFAERNGRVLVVVVVVVGRALRGVRAMSSSDYDGFGEDVAG